MIKPLTSLRFFFAFMVFLSHLWLLQDESPFLRDLYDNVFYEGYIGVSFFFILSGFVLSYNYHDKILAGEIKFSQFGLARFARIYPLHLLTLLVAVPLSFSADFINWIEKFILNLFLLQSFIPSDKIYFYFNSVSWSISDEWFFYLLFPFMIYLLHIRKSLKLVPLLLLCIPILLLLVHENLHEKLFYISPLFRLGDFVIGILLYKVYRKRKSIEYLNDKRTATIAEIASIATLSVFVIFHNQIPQGFRYSCYYWPPMVLMIYIFSYSNGVLSNILSNKALVYLGEISFGFYMIHMLVIRYYEYLPKRIPQLYTIMPKNLNEAYIVFAVSLILSMLLYRWYEKPANKFIKKKLSHKV